MEPRFLPQYTEPGKTQLVINASEAIEITFNLETAGDVVVGTDADLAPSAFNKGFRLETNVPLVLRVPANVPFYIASNTVDRVSVAIVPIRALYQPLIDMLKDLVINVKAASSDGISFGLDQLPYDVTCRPKRKR